MASVSPCTTQIGAATVVSSTARLFSGFPGGCSGKARARTPSASSAPAVRQATRAPALRAPRRGGARAARRGGAARGPPARGRGGAGVPACGGGGGGGGGVLAGPPPGLLDPEARPAGGRGLRRHLDEVRRLDAPAGSVS